MLKKWHYWTGIIFMILFLLTGLYLKQVVEGMPDGPRLLLRSAHIYLFFAALTNLLLGLYYPFAEKSSWPVFLHHSLVLVAPLLLTYSFIFESALHYNIGRPAGALAVLLIFFWLAIEVLVKAWQHWQKE